MPLRSTLPLLALCGLLNACPELPEQQGRTVRETRPRLRVRVPSEVAGLPAAGSSSETAAPADEPRTASTPLENTPPAQADQDAGSPRPENGRPILTPYVVNARDLGGTVVEHGKVVAYQRLFRGPPLAALSAEGCDAFTSLGIRNVIDLRAPSETQSTPEADCVREHATLVLAPLPIPYSVSPQDYIAILDASASIAAVFRVLGDLGAYPVYFHCTWGRDRTGVIAALVLRALGASRDDIVDEYRLSSETVGAYPHSLVAALEEVERRGGIESYLATLGVTQTQLAALRFAASASLP